MTLRFVTDRQSGMLKRSPFDNLAATLGNESGEGAT